MPNKYIASFKNGVEQQIAERSQLIGRLILFFVIVYLFSQIFQSVRAPSFQLWYYAMSQVIILSTSMVAFQIAGDVQNGQIAHFLVRPIHYVLYRFCETIGFSLVRYAILIACYLAMRFFVMGSLPEHFLLGTAFGISGIILFTLMSILIGLSSFWIKEIKPIVYLNLTATFCLGGLIVPLDFYTPFVRSISFASPYPWILWWPADCMARGIDYPILGFLCWGGWVVLLIGVIIAVYNKSIISFIREGA